MDPRFQIGEKVDAHIPGLTVMNFDIDPHGNVTWVYLSYDRDTVKVDLALPFGTGIRFERITPADGEPQPGELWADQVETLYVARKYHPAGVRLVNVDKPGSIPAESWESVHGGPLGPIYRVAARPLIGGQS